MSTLWQDLQYGARMLWRSPGFTIAAVLALALGIGATSAIYTVVDATLLRPLPLPEPQQLVQLESVLRKRPGATAFLDYRDLRQRNSTFSELAVYKDASVVLTGGDDPQHIDALRATPSLFGVLRVPMELGRAFTEDEGRPNSHVVIISHELWKSHFGADRGIVGKSVSVDREPCTIVGVLPAGFHWPLDDEGRAMITPYPRDTSDEQQDQNRGSHSLVMAGRLKPGVTASQAQADLDTIVAQIRKEQANDNEEQLEVKVTPLREAIVGKSRPALALWLIAVLCVLAIACANVAGLLLARATVRQREIAIRVSLGAGRWRIVRQMLTESVLLGVVGGGVGVLLALWLVDLLVSLVAPSLPRLHDIGIDGRVLGVTFLLALVTGVAFGLVPALHASRADLNDALKETGRSTAHAASRRARNALVVGEIAGALILLVGAGLMLRSFERLAHTSPGFRAEGLTVAQIFLPQNRYSENEATSSYRRRLEEKLAALPGASAVTVGAPLPFSHTDMAVGVNLIGQPRNPAMPSARYVSVSPNWFATMGIPMLAGRTFNAAEDSLAGPPALVISKSFADGMWPGENPVGKRVHVGICADKCKPEDQAYEVIAVVADIHHDALSQATLPTMYTAYGHIPLDFVAAVVRSPNPAAMVPALRRAILDADKDVPPPSIGPMEDQIGESMRSERVLTVLLGLFALVALALATIGVYGVMSYTVTQRTREIGVRVALGAGSGEITRMVVFESLRLAGVAAVIGIGIALAAGRFLQSQLFGVGASDPLTLVSVTLLIVGVCALASLLPARRASKVDPMVALRYE
jgi:putative ABC transport system permease protein